MTHADAMKILSVAAGASAQDVKHSFRKLAQIHHPDHGGNEAKFKELTQAYELCKNGITAASTSSSDGFYSRSPFADGPITYGARTYSTYKPPEGEGPFGYTDKDGVFHKRSAYDFINEQQRRQQEEFHRKYEEMMAFYQKAQQKTDEQRAKEFDRMMRNMGVNVGPFWQDDDLTA